MSVVLGLYRLQQVDSQIDQAQARLASIRQTLERDDELRAANQKVAEAENKNREAERALKASEAEVQKQQIKIEQAEASMYGGHIHNPKELQDLQNDVASLKRYLVTLEEHELEAMMLVEETQKSLATAKAELEHVQAKLGDQFRDLTAEQETLAKNLERLNSERNATLSAVEAQSLSMYDQLRQQRRGIAVTVISEGACAACGTNLTPSQQQNARYGLAYCPTCGRILYGN